MKVNGKDYPIYEMDNKKYLKPPTSIDGWLLLDICWHINPYMYIYIYMYMYVLITMNHVKWWLKPLSGLVHPQFFEWTNPTYPTKEPGL